MVVWVANKEDFTTLGYRDHEIDYDRNTGIPTSQSTSAIKWDKVVFFFVARMYMQ